MVSSTAAKQVVSHCAYCRCTLCKEGPEETYDTARQVDRHTGRVNVIIRIQKTENMAGNKAPCFRRGIYCAVLHNSFHEVKKKPQQSVSAICAHVSQANEVN